MFQKLELKTSFYARQLVEPGKSVEMELFKSPLWEGISWRLFFCASSKTSVRVFFDFHVGFMQGLLVV